MTKNHKIYFPITKLAYLTMVMIILLIYCNNSFSADDNDDRVIKSFKEDSGVSNEIDQYKHQGFSEGNIYIVSIDGQCGAAGCHHTLLVIQSLISRGANTQTISVMAEVSLSPFDEVDGVKLVMLTPYGRIRSVPRELNQGITEPKPISQMPRILNQGMTEPKPISQMPRILNQGMTEPKPISPER